MFECEKEVSDFVVFGDLIFVFVLNKIRNLVNRIK